MGDSPTTGAAVSRTASLMPGTSRTTPMLTTGLLGGSNTTSAAARASSTPGAGLGLPSVTATNCSAGSRAPWRTHHSWKCIARRVSPSATTTCVSTRSSLIGSSVTPGCQRSQSAAVTWLSG